MQEEFKVILSHKKYIPHLKGYQFETIMPQYDMHTHEHIMFCTKKSYFVRLSINNNYDVLIELFLSDAINPDSLFQHSQLEMPSHNE